METMTIDLFFVLVILTGWTVAMGRGAFLAWLLYERHEDE